MKCFTGSLAHRAASMSTLLTCRRAASSSASTTGNNNDSDNRADTTVDVDAVARPMGYGPFSASAKARVLREKAEAANASASQQQQQQQQSSSSSASASSVMHHVTLQSNLSLRLSLAGLPHPSQLQAWPYMSPEWRLAFVRLYRTILRLHNKTVAVSLRTARGAGPEAAVAAAVSGASASATSSSDPAAATGAAAEEEDAEDYMLRYLLTPEQQEFGNRFVQGEFRQHMDADAVSASIFYASWYDYVLQLASGVTGREMTEQEKRLLSDEQKEKLNSLRGAFVDLRVAKEPQYMP